MDKINISIKCTDNCRLQDSIWSSLISCVSVSMSAVNSGFVVKSTVLLGVFDAQIMTCFLPHPIGDGLLFSIDFSVCLFVCLFVYFFVSKITRQRLVRFA